ncbi:hypothetical protein [Sulfurospirillum arsenophilum]|uniref:hypothetical protein n=1 Tax=Sulfurospirillum arsenophilum TaxID=56698 RepID=UPI0005AB2836|nr:hypothetical protein [Sulfurospirillum arsenophilum]
MKKLLVLVGLLTSMYAIPPCELHDQKVCTYFYKGAMSAEIIIVNLSPDTVLVEYAGGILDWKTKSVTNLKLEAGQRYTILKSTYEDHEKKPTYNIYSMSYKVIPKNNEQQQTIKQSSNDERKANIKIEMH